MLELNKMYHESNLETMSKLDDNSVDAIVTDPPYGLKFMGKKWDYDVPPVEVWVECLRVLKPGGYLLAFAGTRTQHRMAVRIEDAGFEIRDMIAWIYGCLSDDTEILTKNGWEPYHISKQSRNFVEKEILAYDVQTGVYKWERPERWNEYSVNQDTAYRIKSDTTDQIVSRGHRCLVERNRELVFVQADELNDVECMPTLPDDFYSILEGQERLLQSAVQRGLQGRGLEEVGGCGCGCCNKGDATEKRNVRGQKPGMEGWGNVLQAQGEICESENKVRSLPDGVYSNGSKGRVYNGASPQGCASDWEDIDPNRMRTSQESRCDRQRPIQPNAFQDKRGTQAIRTRARYSTTLATVEAIEYTGIIFCPTVSTGAFVARRNGKVFITGNSGFPKSHNISKQLDKMAGAEREVIGQRKQRANNKSNSNAPLNASSGDVENITIPATQEPLAWQGWGTALKPALEPITVARKPIEGTVAANVLKYGTGGINIDGCRVGESGARNNGSKPDADGHSSNEIFGKYKATEKVDYGKGRFPANIIHDGSDEVLAIFPETSSGEKKLTHSEKTDENGHKLNKVYGKFNPHPNEYEANTGSAARFFYTAKASQSERGKGNDHPTVKPLAVMRYLCRLVTPPKGIIYDPYAGSGTTIIAGIEEGFSAFGSDLDAHHCDIFNLRTRHGIQPKMF